MKATDIRKYKPSSHDNNCNENIGQLSIDISPIIDVLQKENKYAVIAEDIKSTHSKSSLQPIRNHSPGVVKDIKGTWPNPCFDTWGDQADSTHTW